MHRRVATYITVEEKVERDRRRHRLRLLAVAGRAEKERAPTGGRGAEEKGRPRLVVVVDLAARLQAVALHLVAMDLVARLLVVVLHLEVLVEALHLEVLAARLRVVALQEETQVAPLVEALRLVITVDLVARLRVVTLLEETQVALLVEALRLVAITTIIMEEATDTTTGQPITTKK